MLHAVENFLDKETCEFLVQFAENGEEHFNVIEGNEFWSKRVLRILETHPEIAQNIAKRIAAEISQRYNCIEPWCDTIDLIRWPVGWKQEVHEDQTPGFEYRDFGCIIYLNDNYSGGNTYYPNQKKKVQPVVGLLAIHPGTSEFEHGVTTVEGSPRYTIASFWTLNRRRAGLPDLTETL